MNSRISTHVFLLGAVIVGCLFPSALEATAKPPKRGRVATAKPVSTENFAYVKKGDSITLESPHKGNKKREHKWLFGGAVVSTKDEYTIPSMDTANVGTYTLVVGEKDEEDKPILRPEQTWLFHVGMYTPPITITEAGKRRLGNAGTATIPVGCFTTTSFSCTGSAPFFTKGFSLAGSGGQAQLFYGPAYPGAENPPFINDPPMGHIHIEINLMENPGITATAIRIQRNFSPYSNIFCDTIGVCDAMMPDSTKTYRTTIYYNGPATNPNFVFTWWYD